MCCGFVFSPSDTFLPLITTFALVWMTQLVIFVFNVQGSSVYSGIDTNNAY